MDTPKHSGTQMAETPPYGAQVIALEPKLTGATSSETDRRQLGSAARCAVRAT
jgi:hypothetical protein